MRDRKQKAANKAKELTGTDNGGEVGQVYGDGKLDFGWRARGRVYR